MDGQGESVRDTEDAFLKETCEFTGRWIRRLPASSHWHGIVAALRKTCLRALRRRGLLVTQI